MIGFTIKATSSSHSTFRFKRSSWTEGDIWLKHALSLIPSANDDFAAFQKELVSAIEKGFKNLQDIIIKRAKAFSAVTRITILVDSKDKSFVANFTGGSKGGINGMVELVNGMEKFELGNVVCLYLLKAVLEFQKAVGYNSRDSGSLIVDLKL